MPSRSPRVASDAVPPEYRPAVGGLPFRRLTLVALTLAVGLPTAQTPRGLLVGVPLLAVALVLAIPLVGDRRTAVADVL
ncbi:hypothetical protein ACFQH6_06165 [Halobacteriaceae archaeon GCM10025711]